MEFVQEKVSGKVSWRKRKIAPLLEELKKGDTILLSEFSRLGRSMLECMEIISIAVERGIKIYTVKGSWQLDDTIQSKVEALLKIASTQKFIAQRYQVTEPTLCNWVKKNNLRLGSKSKSYSKIAGNEVE